MFHLFYGAKEGKLNIQGKEFDYVTFGMGEKYMIMIQGLNTRTIRGTSRMLALMYRIFAKDYRVYLFDRRSVVRPGITVREMAEDIALAMDSLGISKADIFAVSQGGMMAQYLAIDRPDLVRKLVLAVTLSKKNAQLEAVIDKWIVLAEQNRMKELVRDMAEKMYSPSYIKKYQLFLPLLVPLQKPRDIRRFAILARSSLTCNTYEILEQIKCPVLVLGAGQDQIVTGRASEEIAGKLHCKIYLYEQLGHGAYEEAKDFNQKVYDFFRE